LILGDSNGGDDLRRRREWREEGVGVYGALEVKYEGSSGSESESGYWRSALAIVATKGLDVPAGNTSLYIDEFLGVTMLGLVILTGVVVISPRSSWLLTWRMVLATSNG
jgi:hypothetical protein